MLVIHVRVDEAWQFRRETRTDRTASRVDWRRISVENDLNLAAVKSGASPA
jgi:hypothetical protein